MTSTQKKEAVIAGAGLVGSLWAILLAKRGYQVSVYERRPDIRKNEFSGGRSINLALSERGWKALQRAGAEEIIREKAIPMSGRMIHSPEGDQSFQAYGREGQAIYSVSRGGLNLALITLAASFPGVNLHFEHKCQGFNPEKGEVRFLHEPSKTRIIERSPLIFATDGAFSAIRSSLVKLPRFNYSQEYLNYGYKELSIPPAPGGGHRLDAHALHIWPRGNFMLIALPNIDGSFTCTLFLPYEGPASFEGLSTDDLVMRFFRRYFPDALALMPDLLLDFNGNPTGALATIRCSPWRHRNQVLLLGDAAHAIVPFYGQGMNAGFEDCSILDDMMTEYREDWNRILPEFDKTRVHDSNAIADLALRNFVEMRDKVADPQFQLRKEMEAWLMEKYPKEFLPLYSMVSFSHIPYSQALAEGKAQDRLFDSLLAIENVRSTWRTNPEVERRFRRWMEEGKS